MIRAAISMLCTGAGGGASSLNMAAAGQCGLCARRSWASSSPRAGGGLLPQCYLLRIEGALQPLDRFRLRVQQHRIETTRLARHSCAPAREPVPRREDDLILLVAGDAFGSTAMAAGAAQPDFHEHDAALVLDDQVDFPPRQRTLRASSLAPCATRCSAARSSTRRPALAGCRPRADNASFE